MKKTILIIDDNVQLCETLAQTFAQRGYHCVYAASGAEALRICADQHIQVILLDIMLREENGIDVLKQLRALQSDLPIIMITGYASIETAVQSLKLGAFDYVKKPLDFEHLIKIVENATQVSRLSEENQQLKDHLLDELAPRIVTQNQRMREVCHTAQKFAATNLPVLLTGENGTGKEVLADFIHFNSPRKPRKMLKINCAAFPETLLDNELFGHEKGAYTGAHSVFKGVFERAHGSSLFLDEIGDMPFTIQAKILRTLQNHEIRRIGGHSAITVDVRFIAATNKDVKKLIREEQFREDLFYRLNAAVIHIPPLRERPDDIPLLIEYFLAEYARTNATEVKQVSALVLEKLSQYHWPGNVRELRNVLNYAATISSKRWIELEDLPTDFLVIEQPPLTVNIREDIEKNLILKMLQKTGYNKKKTAEILDMSRRTLYRKLEKYRIAIPQ